LLLHNLHGGLNGVAAQTWRHRFKRSAEKFYPLLRPFDLWLKIHPLSRGFRALGGCGRFHSRSLAMHDDHDPEIEYSPLCQEVAQDGLTVRVQIHRLKTGSGGWSLEVVDDENTSTVWDDLFATDHEALAEFSQTLEDEGIQSFLTNRA
jgi:hypothetical protein